MIRQTVSGVADNLIINSAIGRKTGPDVADRALRVRIKLIIASGAALRRAAAKFHGLLTAGRNRKKPCRNRLAWGKPGRPLDLAGATVLIIHRLVVPFLVAVLTAHAGQGFAQGAFPAPLPGQAAPSNASPFPPVNGAAPTASVGAAPNSFPVQGAAPITGSAFERGPAPPSQAGASDECMKGFIPLREDAERRGKLIKAASDRHASPDEACKLIGNFGQAEIKMIKYVETHAAKCGIPPQITEQLKTGHKNTESMQKKVCTVAQQQQQKGPAGPSLSEVLGSSAALPEATPTKKGGSTFDTLNGNVLTR
jgi:hypothetical protein